MMNMNDADDEGDAHYMGLSVAEHWGDILVPYGGRHKGSGVAIRRCGGNPPIRALAMRVIWALWPDAGPLGPMSWEWWFLFVFVFHTLEV